MCSYLTHTLMPGLVKNSFIFPAAIELSTKRAKLSSSRCQAATFPWLNIKTKFATLFLYIFSVFFLCVFLCFFLCFVFVFVFAAVAIVLVGFRWQAAIAFRCLFCVSVLCFVFVALFFASFALLLFMIVYSFCVACCCCCCCNCW